MPDLELFSPRTMNTTTIPTTTPPPVSPPPPNHLTPESREALRIALANATPGQLVRWRPVFNPTPTPPQVSQTAPNIIALAKELDPEGFKAAMADTKAYIQRRRDGGIPLGPVLEGDQVTLAAQRLLTKHLDDPRAVAMLQGYGEDQFSSYARVLPKPFNR